MPKFDELRDMVLAEPAGMIGYVEQSLKSGVSGKLRADVLKKLFNHAGRPVPKEIEESKEATIALPKKELAELMAATAKKAGFGPLGRAKIYLQTRFS